MVVVSTLLAVGSATFYALALPAVSSLFVIGAVGAGTIALGAAALRSLMPKPPNFGNRGYQTTAFGSALDHQIIYGKMRVGGARIYDEATGTNNKYLHRIIAVAGHEIEAFDDIYINDEVITLDGSGNVTSPSRYNGKVRIKLHLGASDQTADTDLVSESLHWTSAHRLRGIAYMYVRLQFDADAFPNGIPEITSTISGKKVYDPRTSTTAWSDNPALCLRDYLLASYGIAEDTANIDDTLVASAANVCDQTNTDAGTTRYTCNGAFTTASTPYDMINSLLTSMDGSLWYSQGKWRMKPAYWTAPVLDLNEDDLRSSVSVSTRHSRRNNFNTVKGTFRGEESNWQTTDYPQVTNKTDAGDFVIGSAYAITSVGTTDFTAIGAASNTVGQVFVATGEGSGSGYADANLGSDGGQESVADVDLPFTDNSIEARRIARISLERNRQQLIISASFGLKTLQVQVGDNIRLTNSRFGWVNKEFEVVAWSFGLTDGLDLQTQMTLRETSESVYDEVDDGAVYQRDNTTLPSPFETATPQLNAPTASTFVNEDGTTVPEITFTWSVGNSSIVDHYEFQWKFSTDSTYNSVLLKEPKFILSPAESARAYDSRVRSVNALGVQSQFISSPSPISTSNDTTIPNAPGTPTVSGGYAATTVEWAAPTTNTDGSSIKDLFQYAIYRDTQEDPTTLVGRVAGTTFSDIGLSDGTTYYYRIKALDFTGNPSPYSENGSGTTNPTLQPGADGASVLVVYADDAAGTNQSLSAGSYEYIQYYEYITTVPTLPVTGTFVKFVGDSGTSGNSIFPIYAINSSGDSQSFDPSGKTFVTFYESLTTPTLPVTGQTFVEYVGPTGDAGARGPGRWNIGIQSVSSGSFLVGTTYFITTVGTTDFTLIGATSNTVGLSFVATGAGSGDGTATPLPVTSSGADTDFTNAIGDPVDLDQAWFYSGTESNQIAQSVWIYSYSGDSWNKQEEVINGDLIVTGSINASKIAISDENSTSRIEILDNKILVYNAGVLRVKIGDLL